MNVKKIVYNAKRVMITQHRNKLRVICFLCFIVQLLFAIVGNISSVSSIAVTIGLMIFFQFIGSGLLKVCFEAQGVVENTAKQREEIISTPKELDLILFMMLCDCTLTVLAYIVLFMRIFPWFVQTATPSRCCGYFIFL